ncbi:MAG: cation diffusion facilitator family transporter [bacterium]
MENKKVLIPVYVFLIISLGLAGLKLWMGFWLDSSALRSVGVNNAADFLYGIVLYLGLWVSIQPPDRSHPEGHQRFESLVGIFVGIVITVSGIYVLYDAAWTFYFGRQVTLNAAGIIVILGSMTVKSVLSWYCNREGKKLRSPALKALGRDQASDILADATVLVALLTVNFGWQLLDPLVALIIALTIIKVGVSTLTENINHITGRAAPPDLIEEIKKIVKADKKFEGPTSIRSHFVGPRVHISLVVKADPALPLGKVHGAEEQMKQKILALDTVERVYIHVEPNCSV